jgi:hypothetical protein
VSNAQSQFDFLRMGRMVESTLGEFEHVLVLFSGRCFCLHSYRSMCEFLVLD